MLEGLKARNVASMIGSTSSWKIWKEADDESSDGTEDDDVRICQNLQGNCSEERSGPISTKRVRARGRWIRRRSRRWKIKRNWRPDERTATKMITCWPLSTNEMTNYWEKKIIVLCFVDGENAPRLFTQRPQQLLHKVTLYHVNCSWRQEHCSSWEHESLAWTFLFRLFLCLLFLEIAREDLPSSASSWKRGNEDAEELFLIRRPTLL